MEIEKQELNDRQLGTATENQRILRWRLWSAFGTNAYGTLKSWGIEKDVGTVLNWEKQGDIYADALNLLTGDMHRTTPESTYRWNRLGLIFPSEAS